MTDKEKFLAKAREYIGKNGNYVCNTKLHLGYITHWCAYAVSCIMRDCGFIGKYIKAVEGGAGTVARYSVPAKLGEWFRKGTKKPQAGDLFFLRYNDYPKEDKYFCDHIGIVESVSGNTITTLEGNVDGNNNGIWEQTSTFKRKTRYLSDYSMYAFYRPFWNTENKTTSTAAKNKNETEIYQINSSKKVDYTVKVTASDDLNIRQGAGTSYKILGAVPFGTVLNVSKYTSGGNHKWGLVKYKGIKGWIALTYTANISKTVDELAREVIQGRWGNGTDRIKKLTAAGYDYHAVQKKVNQIYKNNR